MARTDLGYPVAPDVIWLGSFFLMFPSAPPLGSGHERDFLCVCDKHNDINKRLFKLFIVWETRGSQTDSRSPWKVSF